MNLYYLTYLPGKLPGVFDTYSGFVVAALRSSQARALASAMASAMANTAGNQKHDFENESITTCKLIGQAAQGVKPGVILSDFFNA